MSKDKIKSMATSLFQKSKDKLWSFGAKKSPAQQESVAASGTAEEVKEVPVEEEKKVV